MIERIYKVAKLERQRCTWQERERGRESERERETERERQREKTESQV